MVKIVICSQKGGVGKTTDCVMLANCLAARGLKGLFIDLDPNNSATMSYTSGISADWERQNVFEMLTHRNISENVVETRIKRIDIIPSSLGLNDIRTIDTKVLKKTIEKDELDYDFIIIDTAPHYDNITINALTAADIIFTPIQLQMYNLTTSEYLQAKLYDELPEQVSKWYQIYSFWRDSMANFSTSVQSQISSIFEQRFENILKDIRIPETPIAGRYLQTDMKLSSSGRYVGEKRLYESFNKLADMIFGESEWRSF